MMPSSEASVRIDDVRAISMASWVVSFPVRELCEQHEEDGCRDMASAAVFDFPGRCVILKRHGRVRCFRRKSREFVISSNVRSPKIFVKGLWSLTMTRLSQPCVKYFVCSRPQATARASPSIAAYLSSAAVRKREPAKVIRHPPGQQSGRLAGHLQCFWKRKYPIPRLDQSGRRHVGRDMSKISTPLRMASIIASLDAWNASSSSAVHTNLHRGLRNGLNGAIRSRSWA